jgi:hypothetical protein
MDSEQEPRNGQSEGQDDQSTGSRWWLLLLLLPYIALLYPAYYARLEPTLWGFPFFIWYQFLWVFLAVAITGFVFKVRG